MFRLGSLILRNVFRNRRRSLLTLASTAVSLAILGFLVALYQGFFLAPPTSPTELLRLVCRHKVSLTNNLPASHQQKIAAVPGVEAVSAYTWYQGKYKDGRPEEFFARFAVDPVEIRKIQLDYLAPAEQWDAFIKQRTGCAVAKRIATKQGIKIGDRITIVGDIYPVTIELNVVMIYDCPKNTECLMFQREYLNELLKSKGERGVDTVGTFFILADSAESVPRIARAVDTMFDSSPWPTKTQSERSFGLEFVAFLGNIKLYLGVVCAAITFTILLVSANTVAMSVRERTREMAILRTLGYTPGDVMQIVLGESVLIALLGSILGIGLAMGLTKVMAIFNPADNSMDFSVAAALIVAVFGVVIGLVSAVVPAYFASRRNIVESLRFTG